MKNHLQLLGIITVLFALGFHVQAETLSGTIIDPQRRVVVGAQVSLSCAEQTITHNTDDLGEFTFARETFSHNCVIRAAYPGFAPLERVVGRDRIVTLQLRLAEVKQTTSVHGDTLSLTALDSVSLSSVELRAISDSTNDLVEYAKHLAGIHSGSDRIYVNGLPANYLPPAEMIERITVNADPFSAEYSDGSNTHVDIVTKSAERKFHLNFGGASLGTGGRSVLDSHLSSSSRTAKAALTGPIPHLPITFTTNANIAYRRSEDAIQAVVPPLHGQPLADTAAPATNFNSSVVIGTHYSKEENLRVNAFVSTSRAKQSNMNVSGLTLPEAGISERSTAYEFHATIAKTGRDYLYRGGLVTSWLTTHLNANSSSLGITVLGDFIAGGADISNERIQSGNWTFKNVLALNSRKHYWTLGSTMSRAGDGQSKIPNAFGRIQFNNLEQYIMSMATGAHSGTWLVTRGRHRLRYVSHTVAPFAEGELVQRPNVLVRCGIRADYQTAGAVLLSPRISSVAALRGFVVRAGAGMFVHDWPNAVFLRARQNDGINFRQLLTSNVSFSDFEGGTSNSQPIVSRIVPGLVPPREWVAKFSVEHTLGRWVPGIEYTWTTGTHVLGSRRLRAPTGWIDMLESNRSSQRHQLHVGMRYEGRGQSLTAHYEWIHARDNTDGPFSFPAIQENIRGEWGPASGISRHNVTAVANLQFGKATSLSLVNVARSAVPLNLISGMDVQSNGLYTDRAGRSRNSAHGPEYNCMELFAHRTVALPRPFSTSRQKLHAGIALQVENLLGNKNYVSLGNVIGSPLLGRPLSALGGRSLRLSLDFAR